MAEGIRSLQIKSHSIIEDYEVQWSKKLGCGVSGPVRPCFSKKTNQRFALKCLIDHSRSRREIQLHFRCCDHPHIVTIHDIYANDIQFPKEPSPQPRLLVVMEIMEGGELFDRISQQKLFTEYQASMYTRQISLAIRRCHSLNIAHRDIKPENLLLNNHTENAVIKLSDFGFAKVDEGNLTTPHFTPYYVAPQVLVAQQKLQCSPYTYDRSCDMWSLGVMIYIMLCGYPPFYSESPTKQITSAMKQKIMAGHYDFPAEDWAHISDSAKNIVKRLLMVDPEKRLTVDQVLEHPWLNNAPYTQLYSPAVFQDKFALEEMQSAHSQQLTNMRLSEQKVRLKPINIVNNPILNKRKKGGCREQTTTRSTRKPCPASVNSE